MCFNNDTLQIVLSTVACLYSSLRKGYRFELKHFLLTLFILTYLSARNINNHHHEKKKIYFRYP